MSPQTIVQAKPAAVKAAPPRVYGSLAAAGAALARSAGGIHVATWAYQEADGSEIMAVLRFDLGDGGKSFRPMHRRGDGWAVGDPPGRPLPLYRLPELKNPGRIYIFEGEKCADAAAGLGLLAVTSAHGELSPGKSDWVPLTGREVVILPDADDAGEKYAAHVARIITALDPPATVRIVRLSGLPEHGDIVDWLDARDAQVVEDQRRELEALADAAALWAPPTEAAAAPTAGQSLERTARNRTDVGNAARLVLKHGDILRFVPAWEAWLVWCGSHWRRDHTLEVYGLAKAVALGIFDEARDAPDKEAREALAKWACQSQTRQRIEAMLSLARPDLAVVPNMLDLEPWLLACENGTVDLRTGQLLPARREDLITRCAPVAFDPAAACPRREQFLGEVFDGDEELIGFVRRACGYSISGDMSEQCFFMLFGNGANGKSIFISALRRVLGPYAFDPGFGVFEAATRFAPHPEHLAVLAGIRFVTASETAENTGLNEQRLKVLSHGDSTSARFLYGQRFEFTPCGKIWLCVNHKPRVDDDSAGFWRGARLIPFARQFIGPAADLRLADKLRAEAPGILAWLVRACVEWQATGLGDSPEAVEAATGEWRQESDPLAGFLSAYCVVKPDCLAAAGDLFKSYLRWAAAEGLPEKARLSVTAFGRRLGARFKRMREPGRQRTVMYQGIGLLSTTFAEGGTGLQAARGADLWKAVAQESSSPQQDADEGAAP